MLVVHKYGGTSVGDLDRIENVQWKPTTAPPLSNSKGNLFGLMTVE